MILLEAGICVRLLGYYGLSDMSDSKEETMAKITCPNCGEIIEVDPSSVEDLTRQLRDELFEQDLEKRLAEAGRTHEAELEVARTEERREADKRVAEAQAQLADAQSKLDAAAKEAALTLERERVTVSEQMAQLQGKLDAADQEKELAVERVRAASADELSQLRAQLEATTRESELEMERVRLQAANERARLQDEEGRRREEAAAAAADAAEQARAREAALKEELARLKTQLESREATLKAESEAELLRMTSDLERAKNDLEARLAIERANGEQVQAALREEMTRRESELNKRSEEQLEAKNAQIEQYKGELDRLRDYRIRLSTKLVGESLERHCESEFNRIRMQAYPKAYFEKDNEAVEGTKGDYIFRDYDDDGNELLSIMFEMKNEEELSSARSRKRNEDHFKKLDADRTKKNCEFAVLVSTLEMDNDFYNAGIADVSWQYPKMFVVRPQCFLTIIGLLKASALATHSYRMQLENARREELDVTRIEEKVTKIVGAIENDYERASKNYEKAEADIDAIIKKLEDLKKQLRTATTWFGAAQKQGDKLTIKRLTYGNQTMKAAFAEAHELQAAQEAEVVEEE